MPKMLPKRYVTEEAVKRALKIDSFRNISKDKVMQFASMIPYMDKDVAIAIINQFPRFADFGQTMVSSYMQICDNILLSNKESHDAVECILLVTLLRLLICGLSVSYAGQSVA